MNHLYPPGSERRLPMGLTLQIRQRSIASLFSVSSTLSLLFCWLVGSISIVQAQQLELYSGSASTSAQGPTSAIQTATFYQNVGTSTTFMPFTPTTTFSVSFANQQYTTAGTPGLTFGSSGSGSGGDLTKLGAANIFVPFNNIATPSANMFTSGPNSTSGTNVDIANNYAFRISTDAYYQASINAPLDARNYYGDITITFSRPVVNPVLHLSGMGGGNASSSQVEGFYTELELSTADVAAGRTLTRLSGNTNFSLDGTNTKILNSNTLKDASSSSPYASDQQYAGAGSVLVNTGSSGITSVTFRVYLKGDGGTSSSASWATGASGTRPSDAWIISSSLALYTIGGTVYNDANGLTDNTIISATAINGTSVPQSTGANIPIYASLVQNGSVIQTVPVTSMGTYSFTVADSDTYNVVLTTNSAGATSSTLPSGWASTGENLGTGTGTDGTIDGIISVTVASSNVTNANLGIERLPTAGSGTATVANAGGTSAVTIPPTAFTSTATSSDVAPGSISSIRLTSFPTNATSLTINGTVYTASSTEFTNGTGILVATTTSGAPSVPILVDPANDSSPVVISFVAIDNAGKESTNTGTATINSTLVLSLSGQVWNDADGSLTLNGSETGTNAGTVLYVNLLNASNTVLGSTTVASDGTYSLANIPSNTSGLKLVLAGTATATTPGGLPTGWVNTGEVPGTGNTATQGSTLGLIELTTSTSAVAGANFGIEQLPTPGSGTAIVTNAGGSSAVTVPTTAFTSTSPSTDTAPGSVTAIRITAFPSNTTSLTVNGTTYTSLLGGGITVPTDGNGAPTVPILVNPTNDANPVAITFVAVDNAGKASSAIGTANLISTTPATPFSCSNLAYQVAGPQGGNSTLYSYNVVTGARSTVAALPTQVNNIGYNSLDNLMWGYDQTNSKVIRIDATGATASFTIPNLPTTGGISGVNDYYSGDVIAGGYLLLLNGAQGTSYFVVDINPARPATYLKLVDPTAGYVLDTSPYGTPLSTGTFIFTNDLTYDPNTGLLRGVVAPVAPAATGNAFKLITLNPTTGTITYGPVVTGSTFQGETAAFGSVFTDTDQTSLYAFANNQGKFYKINLATATASLLSTSSPASNNDGASCVTATLAPTISVSGQVWNDADGNLALNGSENGTNAGGPLYVNLVNSAGIIITSATVSASGSYTLTNVLSNTSGLKIVLANTASSITPGGLPTGYVNTGENVDPSNTASQSPTLGQIELTTGTGNVTAQNFGIEQVPVAGSGTNTVPNGGGSAQVTVPTNTFTNTTPSTDTAPGSVTAIRITAFPSNTTSLVINGVSYTSTSPEFTGGTPTGVVVPTDANGNPSVVITVNPTNDANPVSIPFKAIDNAGKSSNNTGTAVINSTLSATISGTVWNDADGNLALNGSETGTNAGSTLYVNLVDASNAIVASTTVSATGSYSLSAPQNVTGYKLVLTNSAISITPGPLPTGYVNTGESVDPSNTASQSPTLGQIELTTGTTSVTAQNFGIEQLPSPGSGTATANNAGGTSPVTVPPSAFTSTSPSTDTSPGSVTAIRITAFPSNTTSLTINGTVYTSLPAGGIIVPTDGNGAPMVPILVDPTNDSNPVSFTFTAIDNAGKESTTTGTAIINFTSITTISGHVLDDGNGLTDGTVNTSGTSALNPVDGTSLGGSALYATLINSSGTAQQTVPVTSTGTYAFTGVAPGSYSVVLSTNPAGSLTPSLPTSFTNTGENVGIANGSDGTANGILTGITVSGTTPVMEANFGINKQPTGASVTVASQPNPGGTVAAPVPASAFTGSDMEDGTYPNNLSGRTVTLSPATNGTLYYNSSPVNTTTVIANFDPSKVSLDPSATGTTAGNDPTFTYAVADNAGVSSVPATVTLPFTAPLATLSGNVLDDGNGLADNTVNTSGTGGLNPVNGTSLNGSPLYATLVNSGNTIVATVPVTSTGSYSFPGVTPGTYSVVLSTNSAGSLTPSLPTSWTNAGENLGSSAGNDGTPNGILTGIPVGASDVTDANFGIDKTPMGASVTVASQPNPGGTIAAPVPSSAFTGSDQEDGTYPNNLAGRTVTLNPAINGTLYYNGTAVSSTTSFTNFDPTKVSLDPTAPGATVGNDPTFTYVVTDNAGVGSAPATITVPFTAALATLSGSVLDDGNGLNDNMVNTSGTGALNPINGTSLGGSALYATLVNSSNTIVATVGVSSSGTYSFSGVTPGTYSVVLSTNSGGSFLASLPTNWANVGEHVGSGTGNDGNPNGILTGISVGAANVTAANFGIDQLPSASPVSQTYVNPGGTNTVQVPTLTGSDAEDGTLGSGNTFVINSLPSSGTLYYAGSPLSTGDVISGYDPTELAYDPIDGPGSYSFAYSSVDAAGIASLTTTATMIFTTAVPDLVPIIYARPNNVYRLTPMTVVVDVLELKGVATSGLITVRVTKDPLFSLSFSGSTTTLDGRPVSNAVWSLDDSDPAYYILTTTQVIGAGGTLSFGLSGSLDPSGTSGNVTVSSVIDGGSGGEVKINNNTDADKIDYFQQ